MDEGELRAGNFLIRTRTYFLERGFTLSVPDDPTDLHDPPGRPCMAAVDVYEEAPLRDPHHPLPSLPNVVFTPYIEYVTRDE